MLPRDNPTDLPQLMTCRELAAVLRMSYWTARALILSGRIRRVCLPSPKRPGEDARRLLVAREDVRDFIASAKTLSTPNDPR